LATVQVCIILDDGMVTTLTNSIENRPEPVRWQLFN
jgi:hypothetical protein